MCDSNKLVDARKGHACARLDHLRPKSIHPGHGTLDHLDKDTEAIYLYRHRPQIVLGQLTVISVNLAELLNKPFLRLDDYAYATVGFLTQALEIVVWTSTVEVSLSVKITTIDGVRQRGGRLSFYGSPVFCFVEVHRFGFLFWRWYVLFQSNKFLS